MLRLIANILWVVLVGWESALAWLIVGLILCITIVGIPLGKQCFKFAALTFFPFGQHIVDRGGVGSALVNILWFILVGLWLGLGYGICGILFCITIIGIPFGLQCFKLAKLAFVPFGKDVVNALP